MHTHSQAFSAIFFMMGKKIMKSEFLKERCANFSLDPPPNLIYNMQSALLAQLDRATAF